MRTVVIPPPGVFGFGRSRTVGVIAQQLDPFDAYTLVHALAVRGIPVQVVSTDQVVHLHALAPMSTGDEVRALRAFAAVTDSPLAWHPAGFNAVVFNEWAWPGGERA